MPHVLRLRPTGVAALTCVLLAGGITAARATASPAVTLRTTIAGTLPSWATGPAPSVTQGTVSARIYLAPRDAAGLTAVATAVSDPHNIGYAHYLTAAQVQARYGPARAQIAAVRAWARSAGLTVTAVDGDLAGYVAVRGPIAAASRAFGVRFGRFRGPDGHWYRAPEEPATAPATVAGDVLTVSGLDTAPHLMRPALARPALPRPALPPPGYNYWIAHPCGSYYAQKVATGKPAAYGAHQPWTNCGYTPAQIRGVYGVTASHMTGKGQTVAVVDAFASPTMPGDVNRLSAVVGDKGFAPGQFRAHLDRPFTHAGNGPGDCGAQSWYLEETLDLETVHGMAPDANVQFVAAASCSQDDLANALAWIVNHHAASIVSNSWEEPSDQSTLTSVFELIFQAGAAEGIGFFFASGDNGYESPAEDPTSDRIQATYPPESRWVTAVGGTTLAIGPADNYEWETSWGTVLDPLSAGGKSWKYPPPGPFAPGYGLSGGGGVSTRFRQPYYQAGVVPLALAEHLPSGRHSAVPMRVEPDVSGLADPSTGIEIGQTTLQPNGKTYAFSLSRTGGTSVATPVWAAIEADAQQDAGYPLGFANPVIYAKYGTDAYHDVTDTPLGPGVRLAEVRSNYTNPNTRQGPLLYYLRTIALDGEGAFALHAVRGFDDATGIGTPDKYIQSFGLRQ